MYVCIYIYYIYRERERLTRIYLKRRALVVAIGIRAGL